MIKAFSGRPSPIKGKKYPERSGVKHWAWRGGYENKLRKNMQRYLLKKGIKGTHTLQEWQELKKLYGFMCLCCKRFEPEIKLTEDHIIPVSMNGTDNIENIQPLCQSCNSKKYNQTINYAKTI